MPGLRQAEAAGGKRAVPADKGGGRSGTTPGSWSGSGVGGNVWEAGFR